MELLLIENVFFMNIFKNFGSNDSMQISLHEIKNKIDVFVILCSDEILQTNDVRVAIQLAQENNLAESPLGVSCILKSIEYLLDSNNIFSLLVNCFPDDSVCSFTQFLKNLEFMEDVGLNFFCHCSLQIVKNIKLADLYLLINRQSNSI